VHTIAIIIPAYNEAASIVANLAVIRAAVDDIADANFVLVVIDDGSADATTAVVRQLHNEDPRVHLLSLNRHYGKEAAIAAGLQAMRHCDAVVVMDSDLQHPPALIPTMVEHWRQGACVVEAVKASRGNESYLRGKLAGVFYRSFSYFTRLGIDGHTDFKLLDKEVVNACCDLPEHGRFFRGLIAWLGFETVQLPFNVPPSTRQRSAWGQRALFRYAIESITSFTAFPLQIVTVLGGLTFLLSLVIGAMALADKLAGRAVDGFTTVILLILIIGSVLMFSVGLIGIYVGRIYDEVKRRPNFLINHHKSTRHD
jgi:polyisoprenyl-phosphate glycosyltransferase